MHELVNKALYWTGFRGKKYGIGIQQVGKEDPISFSVFKDKRFKKTEGPFPPLNIVSRIGRKRIWGKLEWATGIVSTLGGSFLATNGEQPLPSFVFIGLGFFLARKGKEKRDIASSIINKFKNK